MPASSLIITIATNRNGKASMSVSFCDADGAPAGPARDVILDNRLAVFVANMQAFARAKLTALESAAERRAGDGGEAIAVEPAEGK
jgi:hypothetical protein